jgi:hypothetical protein
LGGVVVGDECRVGEQKGAEGSELRVGGCGI